MRWVPLEANPEIFQQWTTSLGLKSESGQFCDIYGLDPELLSFVPRPVYAVLQLFPVTEPYEKERKARDEQAKNESVPKDMMFFKQTIGNACGTMGILHAVANSPVRIDNESALAEIFQQCKDKTPEERAKYLETCQEIETAHTGAAQVGQTQAPSADEKVDLHFSCFVEGEVDGKKCLIELDGRRPGPINRKVSVSHHNGEVMTEMLWKIADGPIEEGLLESAAKQVKHYMDISDSIQFNLIALTAPAS